MGHRTVRKMSIFGMVLLLGACTGGGGGADAGSDAEPDEPSGATCPPMPTLTYDNFGKAFMGKYCTRCHSAGVTGVNRNGAPADHNFDTLPEIVALADHIDEYAAAGPNATNTRMPKTDPRPTLDERKKLGEWLACEAKSTDAGSDAGAMDAAKDGGPD